MNISSLRPYTTYEFQIRRKINHTVGLWSDWSQAIEAETTEEGDLILIFCKKFVKKEGNVGFQRQYKRQPKVVRGVK